MASAQARFLKKLKSLAIIASGGVAAFSFLNVYYGNEKFYSNILMPMLHNLDPETAHKFAIFSAKWNLMPNMKVIENPVLKTSLWGLKFNNPVGIAAGFDKDAEAVSGLFRTGIGFLEVGSVTPLPQDGNPKPRIFRLKDDMAVINRCGFNSKGHEYVKKRLQVREQNGVVGVNLGKNKLSESAVTDYVKGVEEFGLTADYLVINVSSPNTPGLRSLQNADALETLLEKVLKSREMLPNPKLPVLLKISPDLTTEEKKDIAKIVLKKGKQIDGLIISNTTVKRPNLQSKEKNETGGLSGKPLHFISTELIKEMYAYTEGKIPIIGVGGISSGKDAYEKIKAGASLIQVYTTLIYKGPPTIQKIKKELQELTIADGYKNIEEAVGADHRKR